MDFKAELLSFCSKFKLVPTGIGKTRTGGLNISIRFDKQLYDNRDNISTTIDGREFRLVGRLAGETYPETQDGFNPDTGEKLSGTVTKEVNSSYLRLVERSDFDFASELDKHL